MTGAGPLIEQNKSAKEKMAKAVEAFKRELATLRTGRASPGLFDNIRVEAYGSHLPLNQVATINVPEPRLITLQAWDKSLISHIEKAVINSPLGLVPSVDGQVIRVPIPPLTQERREEMVKVARHKVEDCRVVIRGARRDAKEALEKLKKDGKLPEDDLRRHVAELQKITDEATRLAEDALKAKEKEILET
ncbi:MAG: ribosome recycling factor [Nitrospirae bacterium]|nr:ribosome recycling factor [Nitrospirota bacterium]